MRLTRRQLVAYAALIAVVAAVGVRYLVMDGGGPPAGEEMVLAPLASPAVAGVAAPSPSNAADVLVHVCGAVRAPGVVRLPEGARVAEALELAGGASARADLSGVNLAARVVDGQQIVVPQRGEPGTSAVAAASAGAGSGVAGVTLVNINTATPAELETLPGVGPATAQKIVDYRSAHGGFKTLDDLKSVPGIGEAKFAAVKDAITL